MKKQLTSQTTFVGKLDQSRQRIHI